MNLVSLSQLSVFAAAEAAGKHESSFFDDVARRWTAGDWGMYPIAVCAVVAAAIIFERVIVLFFSAAINKEGFLSGLKKHIYSGDLDKAINYVAGQKATPLTNVIKAGLMNVPKGDEEVQAALDKASLRETPQLEARTGYLAMLGNPAMLAGLRGTVSGFIPSSHPSAPSNPPHTATT